MRRARAHVLSLALATFWACAATENAGVPGAFGDDPAGQEDSMTGFSWVIDEQLAGMPRPGRTRPLEVDLTFLRANGIELLVSLTEDATNPELVADHGMELLHLPVRDLTAPSIAQLTSFVDRARATIAQGRAVGVHCGAGKGRTGTFLAAYLIGQGMAPERAIARVRELRPGSIETEEQERVLVDLGETLARARRASPEGEAGD